MDCLAGIEPCAAFSGRSRAAFRPAAAVHRRADRQDVPVDRLARPTLVPGVRAES
jgi:hypothetical protein